MSSERANGGRPSRRRSHHWYWVAAIPATFVLWLASLAWLALAASWEAAFGFGGRTVEISMIALGVPFAFLTAYFPIAIYKDADYVNRTSGKWAPEPMRQALVALLGFVVLVVLAVAAVVLKFSPVVPVIAGLVVSVPFAVYYLYQRHERIGTP